jgi:dsRNA-specific ribonuclease
VQITRRYPRRRSPILADGVGDVAITPEAATALIGPATGEPLRAARLAEAWFGKPVAPVLQDRLVQQLEQTGLVRRDDHRRGLLWPLTQAAATPEPSAEERELAETLKAENPKGKLLEWCMRRRLDSPTLRESTDADGGFVMELELEIEGERVSSGPYRASAKKVAEQLAAKALLDRLSRQEQTVKAIGVSEAQQISLEQQNPKGKLFEFCAQRKLSHPQFQTEAVVEGYRCVVTVNLPGGPRLHTKPFLAARAKVAEQAAAAALYEQIRTWEQNRPDGPTVSVDRQAGVPASVSTHPDAAPQRPDARVQLNHWRQQQHLVNFGYELMEHHGPSHQPVFVMTAWAELPGGDKRITDPVTASSKKAAQLAAAFALRAVLEADVDFSGLWEDLGRG